MKNLNSILAAYMAVWAIFCIYQFTISRRLSRLKEEIRQLKEELKR